MILLLLACAPGARWTDRAVLEPTILRLDMDRDGRLSLPEYGRVAAGGRAFEEVDTDGDGAISVAELKVLLRDTQPSTAGGGPGSAPASPPAGSPGGTDGPGGGPGPGKRRTDTYWTLAALAEEVVAADPTAVVPDDARLVAASRGSLDAPEARALLAELEAASAKAGVSFPAALRGR